MHAHVLQKVEDFSRAEGDNTPQPSSHADSAASSRATVVQLASSCASGDVAEVNKADDSHSSRSLPAGIDSHPSQSEDGAVVAEVNKADENLLMREAVVCLSDVDDGDG